MATKPASVLRNFEGADREAAKRHNRNADSAASSSRLLHPNEVSGEYDAGRMLLTSLGGVMRPLTRDDLITFKRNADMLGKAFRGGVTAKTIIEHSLKIDRERSNQQIRVALPRQYSNGKMHFVTNAGPDSDVTRHHVLVEFMNYGAGVSAPSKPDEAAKLLTNGGLRCSCDCGRWIFFYSYVATIGKFNAGVPQVGYPRIRNPNLSGMACKHVLRVMNQLSSPLIRQHVGKMIAHGRTQQAPKVQAVSKADAKQLAEQQAKQADWKRSTVESSTEKRLRLAQQRAVVAVADKAKARAAKVKADPAKLERERQKTEASLRRMAAMGGISQKMLASMLAKLRGK